MTIDELTKVFDGCGVPVFDTFAPAGTALPYGVFRITAGNNSPADNLTYSKNVEVELELYTLGKDYEAMAIIENRLQANNLPFDHDTSYLDGQKVLMELYSYSAVTGAVEPVPEV